MLFRSRMRQDPAIYLDGAHNLPALERLTDFILGQDYTSITILFSALKRKDFLPMIALIQSKLVNVDLVCTSFDFPGSMSEVDLPDGLPFYPQAEKFIRTWLKKKDEKAVLFVTGSLYFVSSIRPFLLSMKDDQDGDE